MLFAHATIASLASQLEGSSDRLRCAVAPTNADPLAVARAASSMFGGVRYLKMASGTELVGVGAALRLRATGVNRFAQLADRWRSLPGVPIGARFMVGFSFAPDGPSSESWQGFGSAEVVLPEITVVRDRAGHRLVLAVPAGADTRSLLDTVRRMTHPGEVRPVAFGDHSVHAVPSGHEWATAVGEAVGAIREGSFEKVVLARSVEVTTEVTIEGFELLPHLAMRNPDSHIYGWQTGDRCLIGASPELLVGKRGGTVTANPLAGSAGRGPSDDEDRAIGESLLASSKDQGEHALVVDDIADRLSRVTTNLDVPDVPSLRRSPTVQHLSTQIAGKLADHVHLFELVGRLHPTPAVGGTPRAEALAFIDKVEGIDRGWYSGGIGWVSPYGDGETAIALRCALLTGNQATLYAGNGIVADSVPADELDETRWKLRPMFNLLTEP